CGAGVEVALEGLLTEGRLSTLAIFDKPDPLDGPFFEETIYVTPSRLPGATQEALATCAAEAARALGLSDGPVHVELRINEAGPWLIELAARSIGGLCSRTPTFGTGMSLEEIIVRHALRWPVASLERAHPAAGVMMIPIPRGGILEGVTGLEAARAVPGVEDITISMHRGQRVVPLPEGSAYLGFIFSRGGSAVEAEASLRRADALLDFAIQLGESAPAACRASAPRLSRRTAVRSSSWRVGVGRHPRAVSVAVMGVAARGPRAGSDARTIEVGRGHLEHADGPPAVGRALRIHRGLAHGPRHLEARSTAFAAERVAGHRG